MLERTHRITGAPRAEVLRGLIRSNMPMYGISGSILAGSQAFPDDDDDK
jgi:hypothetical protein